MNDLDCIQVYTLEKVLKMKKDTVSGINFLDESMKVSKPSDDGSHNFLIFLFSSWKINRVPHSGPRLADRWKDMFVTPREVNPSPSFSPLNSIVHRRLYIYSDYSKHRIPALAKALSRVLRKNRCPHGHRLHHQPPKVSQHPINSCL